MLELSDTDQRFFTERLRLRQWRPDDREPFARLNADPLVMEFFPALLERPASDALADRNQAFLAEHGWGLWAVETIATSEFIGFVGLNAPPADMPCSPCVEIGWRLAREHWGRGYATEAARRALEIGFTLLGLEEIVALTAVQNLRSRRVMERLGMRPDAATFEHPRIAKGHPLAEHCIYRLARDAWRGDRRRTPPSS